MEEGKEERGRERKREGEEEGGRGRGREGVKEGGTEGGRKDQSDKLYGMALCFLPTVKSLCFS